MISTTHANAPSRRSALVLGFALTLALAGCGEKEEEGKLFRKTVKLADVPAPVMDVAKKELPDVTFSDAWTNHEPGKDAIHSYEIKGQVPATGKIREVRIDAAGKVLEKEG